jgi:hypothetical protein
MAVVVICVATALRLLDEDAMTIYPAGDANLWERA